MAYQEKKHILGIPEMDAQHAYLYALFDKLERGTEVIDKEQTQKVLEEIEGYVLFHFSSEEHFIRFYKAPGFAEHQTDHERAAAKIIQFLDDFENGHLNPAKFRIFLTGWLMEHSKSIDEDYAQYIRKKRAEK